jgi:hypothetical protein
MTQWTPITGLKEYSRVLGRKMAFVTIAWVILYFISQPFRKEGDLNVLMLFAPMVGAFAGVVIGWYMATDAVEDANMSGMVLRIILVIASVLPMWVVEGIMHLILPTWSFGFGGWMELMAATLMAMAAAVWHESTQE